MPAAKSQAIALTAGLKSFWTLIWNVSDDLKLFCKQIFFSWNRSCIKFKSDFTIFLNPLWHSCPQATPNTLEVWSLEKQRPAQTTKAGIDSTLGILTKEVSLWLCSIRPFKYFLSKVYLNVINCMQTQSERNRQKNIVNMTMCDSSIKSVNNRDPK